MAGSEPKPYSSYDDEMKRKKRKRKRAKALRLWTLLGEQETQNLNNNNNNNNNNNREHDEEPGDLKKKLKRDQSKSETQIFPEGGEGFGEKTEKENNVKEDGIMTSESFASLKLSDPTLMAIHEMGFQNMTQVMPVIKVWG